MNIPIINNLIKIAIGLGFIILIMFISNRIFNKLYKRRPAVHLKFFKSLTDVVLIVICIYYVLSIFEFTRDITKVLLQSGTLLIAVVTFAAQQALGNVVSGFSISISKPYKVDDKIKVVSGGSILAEGIITDVTIRHTIIRTFDGQSSIIPNSIMDSSVIVNTNFTENVGNFLEIEIGYDADIDKARDIIKKLCLDHPLTINTPDMNVLVNRYTSNGLILKTTIWTKTLDDNFLACSDIRKQLVKEFNIERITIPYQTITLSK